jgi:hypothetical protein
MYGQDIRNILEPGYLKMILAIAVGLVCRTDVYQLLSNGAIHTSVATTCNGNIPTILGPFI